MDTTVWVGASDRNDDFHESSRAIAEAIRLEKLPLALTTDFIIEIGRPIVITYVDGSLDSGVA